MRSRIDFDLEEVQRAAQLRRLGRDLHDQAAAISIETVEAMSAVVSRMATSTDYCKGTSNRGVLAHSSDRCLGF